MYYILIYTQYNLFAPLKLFSHSLKWYLSYLPNLRGSYLMDFCKIWYLEIL